MGNKRGKFEFPLQELFYKLPNLSASQKPDIRQDSIASAGYLAYPYFGYADTFVKLRISLQELSY